MKHHIASTFFMQDLFDNIFHEARREGGRFYSKVWFNTSPDRRRFRGGSFCQGPAAGGEGVTPRSLAV